MSNVEVGSATVPIPLRAGRARWPALLVLCHLNLRMKLQLAGTANRRAGEQRTAEPQNIECRRMVSLRSGELQKKAGINPAATLGSGIDCCGGAGGDKPPVRLPACSVMLRS